MGVQSLEIPTSMKKIYKTVWEIKQKNIIDMAVDRGAYVDQSQSLNIHLSEPSFKRLSSCHFYTWKKGLKTGMYYLRSCAASEAIKFTIDQSSLQQTKNRHIMKTHTCKIQSSN